MGKAKRAEEPMIGLVYKRPRRTAAQRGVPHFTARHRCLHNSRNEPLTWFLAVEQFLGTKESESAEAQTDLYFKHTA